ncbi:CbrC family protein [Streptomyces sp. NPDC002328]|uniref:CbrC family protein n=1 Tax=Streptomyces sp. NPDC002328 TaxID=3364642 RepID=UPI0036739487
MGSGLYVYKFRDGDVVPIDASLVREVLEPHAPYEVAKGEPVEWVRTGDGSESDVHVDHGVAFDRPGPGVLDLVAEVALRAGAAVLLMDEGGTVIVTRESDLARLPPDLQANAVVVPPPVMSGRAIRQVLDPRPEPRGRPPLPPFPYLPDPVGTGAVIAADEVCACCGHDQGWICTGPFHGGHDLPDGRLCPYCVAFGTAANRHGVFFHEIAADGIPAETAARIRDRTPGLPAGRTVPWPAHCGDAAEYVGPAGEFRCRVCGVRLD